MAEKGAPPKESGDRLIVKEGWLQKRGKSYPLHTAVDSLFPEQENTLRTGGHVGLYSILTGALLVSRLSQRLLIWQCRIHSTTLE